MGIPADKDIAQGRGPGSIVRQAGQSPESGLHPGWSVPGATFGNGGMFTRRKLKSRRSYGRLKHFTGGQADIARKQDLGHTYNAID